MNPARDPKLSPIAETERMRFLFSRQLDGDLTQAEVTELAAALPSESDLACRRAYADLRIQFQVLPVKPVGESFRTIVRDAIRQESLAGSADSLPRWHRGWISRGIVAVSVASCLAALFLMSRTREGGPAAVNMADIGDGAAARSISADISLTGIAGEAEAVTSEANPEEEELRPFLENDDWRIVVVKVHSKDREDVMRDIEALVTKNGMDIRPIAGHNDQDHRFGILLTSASVDDKVFIENVLPQTDAQSADWNAQSVAESTRESIIQRLQESMKVPTHSEIHFGQVYVTLPKSSNLPAARMNVAVADQPAVAKNSTKADAAKPSEFPGKANERHSEVKSEESAVKVPVLLVFEFASEEIDRI
jgi:hypothetical protein